MLKTVEVPQLQFVVWLEMQRIETVQKTVEVPQMPSRLGSSSSWTRLLTCPLLSRSSTRWSMSLLCRCRSSSTV